MTLVVIIMFFASKYIVLFVWGERYSGAIRIMRILLGAAYVQAVFRAIPGNILAFIGGEKFTLIINVITCFLHVAIDVLLFNLFDAEMAGVALILAYGFSGVCMTIKIRRLCRHAG